jgi:hypothetical protein
VYSFSISRANLSQKELPCLKKLATPLFLVVLGKKWGEWEKWGEWRCYFYPNSKILARYAIRKKLQKVHEVPGLLFGGAIYYLKTT